MMSSAARTADSIPDFSTTAYLADAAGTAGGLLATTKGVRRA